MQRVYRDRGGIPVQVHRNELLFHSLLTSFLSFSCHCAGMFYLLVEGASPMECGMLRCRRRLRFVNENGERCKTRDDVKKQNVRVIAGFLLMQRLTLVTQDRY
jgi:hypothetical protein